MFLAFSTNGWGNMSWQETVSLAKDMGFSGIELHDINDEKLSGKGAPFSRDMRRATARHLKDLGLSIPCVDTGANIADPNAADSNFAEICEKISLAMDIGSPFVRIYGTHVEGLTAEQEDEAAIKLLSRLLPGLEKDKIVLLVETAGVYADTARLKDLLNTFSSDYINCLWDINHPYRQNGESPEQTVTNLGAYIRHVHMKDSAMKNGEVKFRLMGEGDLPIREIINALNSISYEGCLTLEWMPIWFEGLTENEVILAQYVNFMKDHMLFDEKLPSSLHENKRHTGKFIWEKDVLIQKTFPQVLDDVVNEFPDQLAFKYTTLNYTRTYKQFRDDVDTFARSLIALGVKKGSHIAVWAGNVPQWYIAFWASAKIGCVLVTVNTAYKIHEAEYLLRQSDTHTLIMTEGYRDSNYKEIMQELVPELKGHTPGKPLHCKKLPFLRNIVTCGFQIEGALTWEEAWDLHTQVPHREVIRRMNNVHPNDVCNMQYTSGTTGFPKGVMLTHHNIVNNGKCIGDRMDLSTADRMMIQVPMFHCFGMVLAMTAAMTHSASLYPLEYFSVKPALMCINNEKITCFHGVPTMFIALLNHPDFEKTDFSHMRTGIMAGSPCPAPTMLDVINKMNMTEITIVYGQTEASPGCTMSFADDSLDVRVNTVGSNLPGVECKVVDPETYEDLPCGVNGEFVARGYNVMKGYYKMPNATKAVIDKDGWLHTGDLAMKLEDGNYKITGRLKDMIIRGGENIYPKEIEEFILTHPAVSDVQVIGVPDSKMGEEIMACVILKEGASLTSDELKAYILKNMAKHKVPRYIDFLDAFPMNAAGKILKYKLRDDAKAKYGS